MIANMNHGNAICSCINHQWLNSRKGKVYGSTDSNTVIVIYLPPSRKYSSHHVLNPVHSKGSNLSVSTVDRWQL